MAKNVVVKSDLVRDINTKVGLNNREAKDFIENFFEQIRSVLEDHEDVKLSGFGSFCIIHKPPRPGRNPKTGTSVPISARTVVTFRASNKFRNIIHANQAYRERKAKST